LLAEIWDEMMVAMTVDMTVEHWVGYMEHTWVALMAESSVNWVDLRETWQVVAMVAKLAWLLMWVVSWFAWMVCKRVELIDGH